MMDFSKRYDRNEFVKFLQNDFLPEDDFLTETAETEIQQDTKYIKSITRLGACPSLKLAVYEARHTSTNDARVGLSKEIFRFMANKRERKALVLFVPEGNDANYRFSLISIDLNETDDGKIKRTYSNPRRYSYYLGEGIAARTPKDYLIKKKRVQNVADLKERFSVEILNGDFFKEYKSQYQRFCDFLQQDSEMQLSFSDFSDSGKAIRDYVKKMLGRIVFLYFVQRKGWLNGDYRYMSNMFAQSTDAVKSDFLDCVLEPMFFGLLNTPKEERISNAKRNGWDFSLIPGWENIPYLNGGLFEQDEIDKCKSVFPKKYFADLFDFFDTYNFTIDENDPDDNEVGIDPEMLGHIFENLLEDNKDKGAFYTPKEIVQYMCRESVIQYLKTQEPDEQYADAIEHLIRDGEVDKELQDKATAVQFSKWLSEVKVCDPAIGSGAFPMGVLNVLYHSRQLLYGFTRANNVFSPAEVKREIIQNNIYGVDIEQGAVDIARLRFWLSLVVDETEPQPLPNLDYKIMQGNSLLESFMGYDLSRILPVNKDGKISKRATKASLTDDTQRKIVFSEEQDSIAEIQRLMRLYYSPDNHTLKEELKKEIDGRIKEHIVICGNNAPNIINAVEKIKDNNKPFFLWHLYFAEVFQKGGFDIIICNPPYLKERDNKHIFRPVNSSAFGERYHRGKMDYWFYFMHLALELSHKKTIIQYITSRYWIKSSGAQKLIKHIKETSSIIQIMDIGNLKVFDNVVGHHMITTILALKKGEDCRYYAIADNVANILLGIYKENKIIPNNKLISDNFDICVETETIDNHIKLRLGDLADIAQGVVEASDKISPKMYKRNPINGFNIGDGIFVLSNTELDNLQLNSCEQKHIQPYIGDGNIHPYNITKSNRYLIYADKELRKKIAENKNYENLKRHLDRFSTYITSSNKPYGLHRPRNKELFIKGKIIGPSMFKFPCFAIDLSGIFVGMSYNIISPHNIDDIYYILALLNSKFAENWFNKNAKHRGIGNDVGVERLRTFPIPTEIAKYKNRLSYLSKLLSETKNIEHSCLIEIDYIVYRLYNLSYDEVRIIDPDTPITREEYEKI